MRRTAALLGTILLLAGCASGGSPDPTPTISTGSYILDDTIAAALPYLPDDMSQDDAVVLIVDVCSHAAKGETEALTWLDQQGIATGDDRMILSLATVSGGVCDTLD